MASPKSWAILVISERMLHDIYNHHFLKCTLQTIKNKSFYRMVPIQQVGEIMSCPRNPSSSELVPVSEMQVS